LTTAPNPTPPAKETVRTPAKARGFGRLRHGEGLAGYVFLSPWLIGLMAITAIPMLLSLYLSFTNYDILTDLSDVEWVGLANYERMFTADPSYWHACTGSSCAR